MPKHDIVVIGASSGGVEALQELVSQFPPGLPAAVFVVMHVYARTRSFLPEILTRSGKLLASHPADGERIECGRIYVAPPDRHLLLEDHHMHLSMGPKEQHQRPCINVTFRSAALACGERVIGIVLTGSLDDGTAGLWEIKRKGGVAIVQNPEEASYPGMPLNALREIEADYTSNLPDMGPLLLHLTRGDGESRTTELERTNMDSQLTDLTCPDCRGTIWEVSKGKMSEYRCRVGHAYSAKTMLAEHSAAQEKALYAAVVALEEGASLARRLADKLQPDLGERLRAEAGQRASQAEVIRDILRGRQSFSLE